LDLFDYIATASDHRDWGEDEEYSQIWNEVHDNILFRMKQKFDRFLKQWTQSPAGQAFDNHVRIIR
jgi:hypothetical protein